MTINRLVALTIMTIGAVALSGCGDAHETTREHPVNCGGHPALRASGSTAQANAMTRFAAAFGRACPGQSLTYQANGSGAGINEFMDSKTDFGGSDSPLPKGEDARSPHRCGAPVWNLPMVFAQAHHLSMAKMITSAGPEPVAINPTSAGQTISAAWFLRDGNDLALDTISFYRPNRPRSYPIVLATYEVVCSKYPDPQVGAAVRAFLQSAIGAGQDGLADHGYVPIPDEFKARLVTAINAIT